MGHSASPATTPVKQRPCDDFIYSGQLHDCVPRALLLDRRLSPLERNAWQVIRLLLDGEGVTRLPTYERLRRYLTTSPCAAQASCETVARALSVLRLTRWLSLARRRQPGANGLWQGNLYVLHEAPLTPCDALRLDGDYLALLSQSLSHASKAVQWVAYDALQALADDPLMTARPLPEPLQRLADWLDNSPEREAPPLPVFDAEPTSDFEARPSSDSEVPLPASESEVGLKAPKSAVLRHPKQVPSTVLSISKSFSTTRAHETNSPNLPPRFSQLRPEEQSAALATLQRVEPAIRQEVLEEWQARCDAGGVNRPAAYLFGILQKALRGDFHPWVTQLKAAPASPEPPAPPQSPEQRQARRDNARRHMAELRELLGIRCTG
ncbi:STY4528 family pathogenicity island replication protein [Pseudomonas rhodesiae]|uniref:STY4528 family pathogenicity island replication protein n=1 Tax=Pseudomonas rhodesiae TaxID=76760 RepID=UPI0006944B49|nr:STY4528 family pathogenicity island replication protein [Pseudomonas rhodesiae]